MAEITLWSVCMVRREEKRAKKKSLEKQTQNILRRQKQESFKKKKSQYFRMSGRVRPEKKAIKSGDW